MLKGTSEQLLAAEFDFFTLFVFGADENVICTRDRFAKPGDTKAALFTSLLTLSLNDLGIDDHELLGFVLASADVDHGYALAVSDLRSRETNAFRRVHGFPHVGHQLSEFLSIEISYRLGHFLEHGSAIL